MTTVPEVDDAPSCRFERPLRIAALVKQIPVGESMTLGEDGRLVREGIELEMNAYCRRAVANVNGLGDLNRLTVRLPACLGPELLRAECRLLLWSLRSAYP